MSAEEGLCRVQPWSGLRGASFRWESLEGELGGSGHGFWMVGARGLDAVCITDNPGAPMDAGAD
jgi:hypothetical protein